MPTFQAPVTLKRLALATSTSVLLAACGGGADNGLATSASNDVSAGRPQTAANATAANAVDSPSAPSTATTGGVANSTPSGTTSSVVPVVPVAPAEPAEPAAPAAPTQNTSLPPLAMPSSIANGSTVQLECGRLYQGTLDLRGKSNVVVNTVGNCGKAVLSPGQAINGWVRHQGNIYSAPVGFDVAQVSISEQPLPKAHWPSATQVWARANASSQSSLSYGMPNADLVGATLIFKPYVWAIEARRITAYSGNTMSLASTGNVNFGGYALGGQVDFYVEGKLWMLDEPGEWAVSNGRLYVWAPDGLSPEGRVWASPDKDGIDASDSQAITVDGVAISGAANGINATGAVNLHVLNVDIRNSSGNGILNSGGSGLRVDAAAIRNSRHDAIALKWGGGGERITNSTIDASGSYGMPTNSHAAINLTLSDSAVVENNRVTNSGYIGIRVFRNAVVSGNTVDGACRTLTDCGGIFTSSPERTVLNTRIENNLVRNVGPEQILAWGIYLGDYANGTSVSGNTVTGSGNGMEILNGYDNTVSGNVFAQNTQAHVQIVEAGASSVVRNNAFNSNAFSITGRQEIYRISSDLGTSAVARFGTYSGNRYTSTSSIFANFNGEALSFTQWQSRTGQDGNSVLNAH
ncbi:right-handed parallel beta-helix repeat-containing protein [Noviherbaspirillum sp. CPCC 100848]|uniref:Right-handed parallel beta-helix repeat-containing protein n=1 Tax=Noviherbaspirillum album TaxID=3080276 RepID=A0ABU6JBV4_9BURK|nr:right-handed parallel beta-helix repeat-containing protein [Noviherbaspirillum sp. CPCC 100848]MEC4720903.1 right-handed parallel beta-helix repeat-containing protein [Noviherbaspirillum sp. CPCC 100848]